MRRLLGLLIVGLLAVPAAAQPYYARGQFDSPEWSETPTYQLTDNGGGYYSTTIGGFFPGIDFEYKIATGEPTDWAVSVPGGNGKVTTDNDGEINFNFWDQTSWTDGWQPANQRRVGYEDPEQYGWELIGSFNERRDSVDDVPIYMANEGSGLYTYSMPMNKGFYSWKFRKQDSWDVNVGNNGFTHQAGNNEFRVWSDGDIWNFELDLPNGRWRAYTDAPIADLTGDDRVEADDYVLWRHNQGGGEAGYDTWSENFGFGTEPIQWYARGSWSGFNLDHPMTKQSDTLYTAKITGLVPTPITNPNNDYTFKVANSTFSQAFPGSDAKVRADANGEVNLNFWVKSTPTWDDGWSPNTTNRVGYQDSNMYDWEIVGSFNGWPNVNDPEGDFNLDDMGNGLHAGQFSFAPGTYFFKFRHLTADQATDNAWSTSIGNDFGNSAGDISFTVGALAELWNFELDLPNGRWRVYLDGGGGSAVPEPATMALALFGLAMMA